MTPEDPHPASVQCYWRGCRRAECRLAQSAYNAAYTKRREGAQDASHGSRARYQCGCRCLPCRSANAAYNACRREKRAKDKLLLGTDINGHDTAIKIRYLIGEGYSPGVLMALIGLGRRSVFRHTKSSPVTLRTAYKVQRFWRQQQAPEGEAEP